MKNKLKLITTIMFAIICSFAWAVPGTGVNNLQTTAGVTTSLNGGALTITAPNKSVLTWQNFGSGADTIAASDLLNYVLPGRNDSVLNIVAGNSSSTIDGTITSNGNVFILNPQGVIVGGGARIEVNKLHISTSDNPAFASYYFQQNGNLPSQAGLVPAAGTATVNSGAVITVTDNITIAAKNITIGGIVTQGSLYLTADGNVNVGSAGLAYVRGGLNIYNPTGATVIGSAGNNLIVTEAITSTGTTGSFTAPATASIQARSLTVTGGSIVSDRVNTNTVNATGTNVAVAVGNNVFNPTVNVTGNGTVNVTSPTSVTANITNTGNGATTVNALGSLTLNTVQVEGAAGASFTGASVNDTANRIFVYGPTSFTATAGNVTVNKGSHSFGPLSVAATGNAVVLEDAATNLNVVNATNLTLRSTGAVFQTPITGVISGSNNTITAAGNITLSNINNAGGNYTLNGKDVAIANTGAVTLGVVGNNVTSTSTGQVTLADVTATGTLTVNTTAPITQAVDTKVRSVGATTLNGSALTVTNTGNQFGALSIDVSAAGNVSLTEDTTLNLASLRAASATLKSLASVITSSAATVAADNFNIEAGADFVPTANFRAANSINVKAGSNVDLSQLSFVANLNSKNPTVITPAYKAPAP